MTPAPTLLAVAHGTRSRSGIATTEALLERVRTLRPGLRVCLAYLDLVRPSVHEALAATEGETVVVPLLLGAGYHVRADLPARAAPFGHRMRIAPPLGPDPLLAAALADRLAQAGRRPDEPVVLAAAGSTALAANEDTARMAELLAARLGTPVVPAYLCASSPTPAQAVAALRTKGHDRIAVAAYLLAPGHFTRSLATAGGALTTAPLGTHDALARLILRRYDAAVPAALAYGAAGQCS